MNHNHRRGGLKQQRPESSVGGAPEVLPSCLGVGGETWVWAGSEPRSRQSTSQPGPRFPHRNSGSSLPEMELLGEADPWKPHQHGVRCRASPVPTIPFEPRVVSELF